MPNMQFGLLHYTSGGGATKGDKRERAGELSEGIRGLPKGMSPYG